jgi:mono/diheme cytochrome c family protein
MFSTRLTGWLVAAVALCAAGCQKQRFTEPYQLAGGKTLPVKALNDGHDAFMLYCYGCHGKTGDGRGPSAPGMRPPPRDFRQGLFKFAGTSAGMLPTDEALARTIRRGLNGTPMLPWDVAEVEVQPLIAYIKTLSPRWKEEEPGAPIEISPDPWKGKEKEAIEKGKEVYHVSAAGHAGCSGCHAAYATREEMGAMSKKIVGEAVTEFAPEMHRTSLRETEYPVETNEKGELVKAYQILPPDFLHHKVRTVYPIGTRLRFAEGDYPPGTNVPTAGVDRHGGEYTAEMQRVDLYRAIGAGVGGAAMPQWKGALPEENLWALVYYVQSLINVRDTPEAMAMRRKLEADTPPAAPPPPAEGGATQGGSK